MSRAEYIKSRKKNSVSDHLPSSWLELSIAPDDLRADRTYLCRANVVQIVFEPVVDSYNGEPEAGVTPESRVRMPREAEE